MRAYFFGNMYLSSIQQGIQAHHASTEMYNKYFPRPTQVGECCFDATEQSIMLADWGHDHKTDVLLNGGDSQDLLELESFLEGDLDSDSVRLNNHDDAASSFGIVLPPKIYDGIKLMNKVKRLPRDSYDRQNWERNKALMFELGHEEVYNDWEIELMQRINRCKLAI